IPLRTAIQPSKTLSTYYPFSSFIDICTFDSLILTEKKKILMIQEEDHIGRR
ncbi:7374_t:CDS:1, partial [Funneliformis caledonium]